MQEYTIDSVYNKKTQSENALISEESTMITAKGHTILDLKQEQGGIYDEKSLYQPNKICPR